MKKWIIKLVRKTIRKHLKWVVLSDEFKEDIEEFIWLRVDIPGLNKKQEKEVIDVVMEALEVTLYGYIDKI